MTEKQRREYNRDVENLDAARAAMISARDAYVNLNLEFDAKWNSDEPKQASILRAAHAMLRDEA